MKSKCKKIRKKIKKRRGFTLIELMVVLVILGTLITVLYVAIKDSGVQDEAKSFEMKAERMKLEVALFRFQTDVGRLPTSEEGLSVLWNCSSGIDASKCKKWVDNENVILDPWQKPYHYNLDDNGNYEIISYGQDGQPGGEGSAADINLKTLQ